MITIKMMMLLILIMVVMIWMNLLCSRCMQRISESVIKCWTGKSERRLPCAKHWGNVEEEDSDEDFWGLWWGFRWFWFVFGGIWGFFWGLWGLWWGLSGWWKEEDDKDQRQWSVRKTQPKKRCQGKCPLNIEIRLWWSSWSLWFKIMMFMMMTAIDIHRSRVWHKNEIKDQ